MRLSLICRACSPFAILMSNFKMHWGAFVSEVRVATVSMAMLSNSMPEGRCVWLLSLQQVRAVTRMRNMIAVNCRFISTSLIRRCKSKENNWEKEFYAQVFVENGKYKSIFNLNQSWERLDILNTKSNVRFGVKRLVRQWFLNVPLPWYSRNIPVCGIWKAVKRGVLKSDSCVSVFV